MKKKAAFNISIQAIVVLILAITILGLGLTFIRNMFGKTTGQLDEVSQQIEEQIIDDIKSSNDRVAFYKTQIELKKAQTKEMYFGIRNDLQDASTFDIDGDGTIDASTDVGAWNSDGSVIVCYDAIDETGKDGSTGNPLSDDNFITFDTFATRNIEKDTIEVLTLKVTASSIAVKTTYACAMIIAEPDDPSKLYGRKDFYVKVI